MKVLAFKKSKWIKFTLWMKLCVADFVQAVVSIRPDPQSEETVFENSVPFIKVSQIIDLIPRGLVVPSLNLPEQSELTCWESVNINK